MKINHFETTVPRGTLTDQWCADLDQMLFDIFGWEGKTFDMTHPQTGVPVRGRVYQIDDEQFFVINEHEEYMTPGYDDHIGFSADSRAEVLSMLESLKALGEKDDRLSFRLVTDGKPSEDEFNGRLMTGFYVKYLLPVFFDIQSSVPAA